MRAASVSSRAAAVSGAPWTTMRSEISGKLARKETRASDGSTAPATISSSADSVSPKVWKMRDRYTSPPRSVRSHGSTVSSIMTFISRGTPGRTTR